MARCGIILIVTRKYDVFLQQFIDSAEKYFFPEEEFDIYLFTDKESGEFAYLFSPPVIKRWCLYVYPIPSYTFPWATLFRYKVITEYADRLDSDYLFYSDIDMRFVAPVGEEILCDGLTAVRHPGFHRNNGWGSPKTHQASNFHLQKDDQHDYYAGGFQGGRREEYLNACSILMKGIDDDLEYAKQINYTTNSGILAQWHDESVWNWYLKIIPPKKILDPSYCMVEQMELRKKWGIDDLTPRLIALKKDHAQIRS